MYPKGSIILNVIGLFSLMALTFGCSVSKNQPLQDSSQKESVTSFTPEITTIIFEINEMENTDLPDLKIHERITAKGVLKQAGYNNDNPDDNYFIVEILDNKNEMLSIHTFPNPLKKSYETTDEKGQLERHQVELKKSYHPVRIQSTTEVSGLLIYFVFNGQKHFIKKLKI